VIHDEASIDGSLDHAEIAQVASNDSNAETLEPLHIPACSGNRDDLVTLTRQPFGEMPANEPRRPGDENSHA
jgi:hypothetical protein